MMHWIAITAAGLFVAGLVIYLRRNPDLLDCSEDFPDAEDRWLAEKGKR